MSTTACPSCRGTMTQLNLPGKLRGPVTLDLCFACQGIWFDQWESHQIAPPGIIDLFKLIHAHGGDLRLALADSLRCPRCNENLIAGLDIARTGRFAYHRCPQNHGRFTVFGQYMIEKGFVRQLTPAEIRTLAARIGTVRCSGCGAPANIQSDVACPHCRAPIAILDPDAVDKALENYGRPQPVTAASDPQLLAETILAVERMKNTQERERQASLQQPVGDLVTAGVDLIWRLIRH